MHLCPCMFNVQLSEHTQFFVLLFLVCHDFVNSYLHPYVCKQLLPTEEDLIKCGTKIFKLKYHSHIVACWPILCLEIQIYFNLKYVLCLFVVQWSCLGNELNTMLDIKLDVSRNCSNSVKKLLVLWFSDESTSTLEMICGCYRMLACKLSFVLWFQSLFSSFCLYNMHTGPFFTWSISWPNDTSFLTINFLSGLYYCVPFFSFLIWWLQ